MNELVEESVGSVWFCNKCKNALQRNKVPTASQFNKMKVAKIPIGTEHTGRAIDVKGYCFHENDDM